jgi:hypothetical protein
MDVKAGCKIKTQQVKKQNSNFVVRRIRKAHVWWWQQKKNDRFLFCFKNYKQIQA